MTTSSTPLLSSWKQVPKLSTATEIAMQKARESIKLIPKKRSFEEGILEIQEYVFYYQLCKYPSKACGEKIFEPLKPGLQKNRKLRGAKFYSRS
jgi:hypothetical protein